MLLMSRHIVNTEAHLRTFSPHQNKHSIKLAYHQLELLD